MIVIDTSVAVAAAAPWHARHTVAAAAFPARETHLVAHVAVETYSVLTRLPPPQRVPAAIARAYLLQTFVTPTITLSAEGYDELLEAAARARITGGAVYDALVAATARAAGATLLTLDERAVATYQVIGVEYRLLR